MSALNAFEYGQVLRANIGQDVSTNTSLTFILQPKEGVPKNVTSGQNLVNAIYRTQNDGVTVGASDVVVGDETYLANEYLEYTLQEEDLSLPGLWRVKGEAQLSPTGRVSGDFKTITVLA